MAKTRDRLTEIFKIGLGFLFLIIVFCSVFWVVFSSIHNMEIEIDQYDNVKKMSNEYPQLNSRVANAYNDDIITYNEYADIIHAHDKLLKESMMKKFKEN